MKNLLVIFFLLIPSISYSQNSNASISQTKKWIDDKFDACQIHGNYAIFKGKDEGLKLLIFSSGSMEHDSYIACVGFQYIMIVNDQLRVHYKGIDGKRRYCDTGIGASCGEDIAKRFTNAFKHLQKKLKKTETF